MKTIFDFRFLISDLGKSRASRDKTSIANRKSQIDNSSGAALIVVLSFIVLLMAVLMAYFSQSLLDRQVSKSSTSSSLVQHFSDGAVNTIIDDLRAEIKAGSTATNVVTGSVVYYPKSPTNMVPALAGSTGTNGLENLVKRSSSSNVFYPGAPTNRAAASPTTNASANGRYISPARWNKPLFIRPTGTSDLTPVASAGFVAPDWIFVARDGSNPTQWNTNMRWSETDPTAVVGRYAYAIYDEGGLLDANVAGYPTTLTNQPAGAGNVAYKRALPYADLTQILSNNVDALVGWRNKATLDQGVTNYIGYVDGNTNGFLKTANTQLTGAGKSDRMFVSRQELVNFFSTQLGGSSDPAVLNALQYLTTFSRDLNQPSVAPATNRPAIVSGIGNGNVTYSDYGGGNDGYGHDDPINPSFLTKTVVSSFKRKDGTTAAVGEQLVKKRFPLECLAWITCKGPSGPSKQNPSGRNTNDADMAALLSKPGVTKDLLDRGTDENIRNYFGLVWDSTDYLWNYAPGAYGSTLPWPSAPVPGRIQRLEEITGREPNFIELLKATIAAGSLGKSLGGGSVGPGPDSIPYEVATGVQAIHLRDSSIDAHVIQIAANIIEQAAVDGYPKRIRFHDSVKARIFAGVENLPYFYGWRNVALKLADSIPSSDTYPLPWTTTSGTTINTSTPDPSPYGVFNPPTTSPGVGVELIIPEIWNPHDPNSAVGVIRPGAGELRVVADSIIDIPDVASITNGLLGASPISSMNLSLKDPSQPFSGGPDPFTLNPSTSALVFGDNNGLLFREPTALRSPNIPAGSGLSVANTHELKVLRTTLNALAGNQTVPPVAADGSLTDFRDNTNKYLGIFVGHFPLAWFTGWKDIVQYPQHPDGLVWSNMLIKTTQNGNGTYTSRIYGVRYDCNYSQPEMTFRVQCKDAFGNWIDYDTKFWTTPHPGSAYRYWTAYFDPQDPSHSWIWKNNLIGYFCYGRTFDPRTSRFGIAAYNWGGINFSAANPAPFDPSGTSVAWDTWASQRANALGTTFYSSQQAFYNSSKSDNANHGAKVRVAANAGFNFVNPTAGGEIQRGYPLDQILTQNNPLRTNYYDDSIAKNSLTGYSGYYTDADGVIRRAMGAFSSPGYSSGATTGDTGLPTSTATTTASLWQTATAQSQSRPIILHRPFRSVAELGYVFRDFPWKNLDFFTPESGDVALLDVFCIHDNSNSDGLVAGKVNLNTRQAPVIQAILSGAYKDEEGSAIKPMGYGDKSDEAAEPRTLANLLVTRSTSAAAGKGPLRNLSELVGAWVSGTGTSAVYDGFSKDIPTTGNGPAQGYIIQRYRESAIRPLANCGQTRVWNLMIDIVAQSGRFPANADSLGKFVVEAEQRRWVHVAIDRLTGKVLDLQIESVNE